MTARSRRLGLTLMMLASVTVFAWVVGREQPLPHWLFVRYARVWALAAVFGVSCFAAGHTVVRRLVGLLPLAEHAAVSFSVGVVCFFVVAVLSGLLGLYGAPFFFLGPLALLALGGSDLWRTLVRVHNHRAVFSRAMRPSGSQLALLAFGLVGVVLIYLPILTPDNASFDARWYHLPIAEHYVASGRLAPFTEGWINGTTPHLASFLYTWAFSMPASGLFDRVELAAHVELVVFLGSLAAVSPLCARALGERRAPLAWIATFLFPGILCYDSGLVLGADHVAAVFAAPTLLVLLRAWRAPSWRWGLLLGIPIAGLLSTKATAIALVPFPLLAFVWGGLRGCSVAGTLRPLTPVLVMLGSIVMVTSPYWGMNLIHHGDPLYPVLRHILPAHPWSDAAEAAYVRELTLHHPPIGPRGFAEMARTLATFSFVPHDFAVYHGTLPVFGSLFTFTTPALLLLGRRPRLWVVFGAAYATLAAWFWIHQYDRYLQSALPYFAAATAAVLTLLWRQGSLVRAASGVLVALQVVWGSGVVLIPSHQTGGGHILKTVIDHLASGRSDARTLAPPFAPMSELASAVPHGAKVLVHEEDLSTGLGARMSRDYPGFQGAFAWGEPGMATPSEIAAVLQAHDVTHVLWRTGVDDGLSSLASNLVFHDFVRTLRTVKRSGVFSLAALDVAPTTVTTTPPRAILALCPEKGVVSGIYPLRALTTLPVPIQAIPRPSTAEVAPITQEGIDGARYAVLETTCATPLMRQLPGDFEVVAMRGSLTLYARR